MKDEQIVKALPTVSYGGHSCNECKYKIEKGECRCGLKGCVITRNALDLINRKNVEMEKALATIDGLINGQETLQKYIAEKDAEIERLKDDKNRLEKMMDNLSKELDAEKIKNF